MESITIGTSPIGLKIKKNHIKITIGGSGGGPAPPAPAPVAAYSEFIAVSDPCIMGIVTSSWEEISDGN